MLGAVIVMFIAEFFALLAFLNRRHSTSVPLPTKRTPPVRWKWGDPSPVTPTGEGGRATVSPWRTL